MSFVVESGKKVVNVKSDICISCGVCWTLAPKIFEQDRATGKSRVRRRIVDSGELINLLKVVSTSCPTGAIEVYND